MLCCFLLWSTCEARSIERNLLSWALFFRFWTWSCLWTLSPLWLCESKRLVNQHFIWRPLVLNPEHSDQNLNETKLRKSQNRMNLEKAIRELNRKKNRVKIEKSIQNCSTWNSRSSDYLNLNLNHWNREFRRWLETWNWLAETGNSGSKRKRAEEESWEHWKFDSW